MMIMYSLNGDSYTNYYIKMSEKSNSEQKGDIVYEIITSTEIIKQIVKEFINFEPNLKSTRFGMIDWSKYIVAIIKLKSNQKFCLRFGDIGLLIEGSLYIKSQKNQVCIIDNAIYPPFAPIIPNDKYIDSIRFHANEQSCVDKSEAVTVTDSTILVLNLKALLENRDNSELTLSLITKYFSNFHSNAITRKEEIFGTGKKEDRVINMKKLYPKIYSYYISEDNTSNKQKILARFLEVAESTVTSAKERMKQQHI